MEEQKLPPIKGAAPPSSGDGRVADRRAKFRKRDAPVRSSHEGRSNLKVNTIEWSSEGSSQLFDWNPKEVITFDQMIKQVNDEHEAESASAGANAEASPIVSAAAPRGLDKMVHSVEQALDPWIASGRVTPSDVEEVLAGLVAKQVMRRASASPNAKNRLKNMGAPRPVASAPVLQQAHGDEQEEEGEEEEEEEEEELMFKVETSGKQRAGHPGAKWKTASKAEEENMDFAGAEKGVDDKDGTLYEDDDGEGGGDFDEEQVSGAGQSRAEQNTAFNRTASHRTASHRIAPHRTTSHRIAPYRTASHRIASRGAHDRRCASPHAQPT